MRKNLIAICIILCLASQIGKAQDYSPTTNWPYLFQDFMPGKVYLKNDMSTGTILLNIHIDELKLQNVTRSENIETVIFPESSIEHIDIGEHHFIYLEGKIMESIDTLNDCKLLMLREGDFVKMFKLEGTYNIDLNTSFTLKKKSLGMKGYGSPLHYDMKAVWYDGRKIPLSEIYYLQFPNFSVRATHKDCERLFKGSERKQFNAFIHNERIDWHNTSDLIKVIAYIRNNKRQ